MINKYFILRIQYILLKVWKFINIIIKEIIYFSKNILIFFFNDSICTSHFKSFFKLKMLKLTVLFLNTYIIMWHMILFILYLCHIFFNIFTINLINIWIFSNTCL